MFTEMNLSWLIYESIKAVEIQTSIIFNLFLLIALFYYAFSSFSWLFNPTAELEIPIRTATNEENSENEKQPLTSNSSNSKA